MFYDIFTIFSAIMKVITMIFMILLLHKIALLNGSIINWTDDKIHQSNFHVFE